MTVHSISAVTLAVREMSRSVDFYQGILELPMPYGGPDSDFTSFRLGEGYLNLILSDEAHWSWWGRIIFYVDDVDLLYQRFIAAGVLPTTVPEDAPWRERYFHVNDPDGHGLSFAKPTGQKQ